MDIKKLNLFGNPEPIQPLSEAELFRQLGMSHSEPEAKIAEQVKAMSEKPTDPKKQFIHIYFEPDANPQDAADVLLYLNAHVIAPSIMETKINGNAASNRYSFVTTAYDTDNLDLSTVPDNVFKLLLSLVAKEDLPKVRQYRPNKNTDAIIREVKHQEKPLMQSADMTDTDNQIMLETQNFIADSRKSVLSQISNAHDRINFLYSWFDDNCRNIGSIESHNEAIYKCFLRKNIEHISAITNPDTQNKVFTVLMKHLVFMPNEFAYKLKQFQNVLGVLKNSKPLSMPLVLDDGTHTDLFKLNTTKMHDVMHSINVSKTSESIDLSNLNINGDLICSKAKAAIGMPNKINGTLDCSGCKCKITKIPFGTVRVQAAHTFNKIAELNTLEFPSTVREILLARSVIKNAVTDSNELGHFRLFTAKYPNIEILDDRCILSMRDALEQQLEKIEQKKQPEKAKSEKSVVQPKTQILEKTADHLSRKEIAELCKNDERFIDTDIDRLIKRATPKFSKLIENRMFNGASVVCVHRDNVETLLNNMVQILQEDLKRVATEQPETNQIVAEKAEEEKNAPAPAQKPEPVVIEKYFPKSVWKSIETYCGDSSQVLYSVLETANQVNQLYINQKSTEPVLYLNENYILQPVPGTYVKTGKAAAQRIGNDNGTRIVWTLNPDDKIMVAIAFYDDHTPGTRQKQSYDDVAIPAAARGCLLNGKTKVNAALVKQGNYLNIRDLMDEYKPTQKAKPEPVVKTKQETKPKKAEKVAKKTVSTQPADSKPAIGKATKEKKIEPVEQKPIEQATVTGPQPLQKIDLSQIDKMAHEPTIRKRRIRRTKSGPADIESIGIMLEDITYSIDKEIRQDARDLVNFSNIPENQLKIAKHILELVNKKITLLGK